MQPVSALEGYAVFDFLKATRAAPVQPAPDAPAAAAPRNAQSPDAASYREFLRIVVRDTLRRQGIPAEWISSQISLRPQPGQSRDAYQIELTVQKWNEALMRFAPLLQQQILLALQPGGPAAAEAGDVRIVWAYAPDCGYPYTSLPQPDYWSQAARKFDLPPSTRKFHEVDDDFATTVPSPLR